MKYPERLLSNIEENEAFIPYEQWKNMAINRYGTLENIAFVCPKCGHRASTKDYTERGFNPNATGFICLGFFTGEDKRVSGGPCRYNPLKMINENPILIKIGNQCYVRIFDFADNPIGSAQQCQAISLDQSIEKRTER